ncbi:MAG: hypothetical protein ACOX3E_11850 [Desulfomonilia bacterium]|uniref:Uncharacterized protein n=1 Tax=anaerobic digester metagenome TaxID=1263854 RepID=A0A485LZ04_9ZZZZ
MPPHITPWGLTTCPVLYEDTISQINFDFIDHELRIAGVQEILTAYRSSHRPACGEGEL